MRNIAKNIFLVVGIVMPIFIGVLHTFVHFTDLVAPGIKQYLQEEFVYAGKSQPLWDAWGVANFMMGISFIVIGLLNISTLRNLSKTDYPPVFSILAMMVYLAGVVYVGLEFQQSVQLYGGLVGMVLISICLLLTLKKQ